MSHEDYEAIKRGEAIEGGDVEDIKLPINESERELIERGQITPTDPEVERKAQKLLPIILEHLRERLETLHPRGAHREEGGTWTP